MLNSINKQNACLGVKLLTTKNGRKMMKCKCVDCGITKTKFVKKGTAGKGLLLGKNSPFKNVPILGAIL